MKVCTGLFVLLLVASLSGAYQERCPRGSKCTCTLEWAPVCSTRGCTYSNKCNLICAGADLHYKGECGRPERG